MSEFSQYEPPEKSPDPKLSETGTPTTDKPVSDELTGASDLPQKNADKAYKG